MTAPASARVGVRLRRFREERGLTQAALASALGISASYVNQLESSQRPLTASVLVKLASVFGADLRQFSAEETERLVAQLRDAVTDPDLGEQVSMAETRELAVAMPDVARYVIELHRRYRHGLDVAEAITARIDADTAGSATAALPTVYEEVRDLFYDRRNYFADLDLAAERIFAEAGLVIGETGPGITARLAREHGIRVTELAAPGESAASAELKRHYQEGPRILALSPLLSPGQRAFQLAAHLALTELADEIDEIIRRAPLSSDETRAIARLGLANYVAGALILPYRPFLDAARALRYDIELLQQRFRVGYETVAHRLSTLQRPGAKGVPFFFIRVDRAGNISKRQSATSFHFSRVGGSCPLWNVYEAFARPGHILTQLTQMPDGRSYLWIARTVARRGAGYGAPAKTFAIGLGCDLRHARELTYSDGLDLASPSALVPIGPGCKVCDREACPQRAFPAIGKPLDVSQHHSRFIPYATRDLAASTQSPQTAAGADERPGASR